MDVIEAITKRRSVRNYLETPVEWDKVATILDSGRLAPSAGNIQDWKFIVVTDIGLRKAIAEAAISQNWMTHAPVFIVVCADIARIQRSYGVRGERLYSIQDCAIAATQMMLTAQSLGLATCWVGAFDEGMIQRALGLPDFLRPQVVLTIGYPDGETKPTPRMRLENMVFMNGYGNIARIKDVGRVLWDYNVVGRAVDSIQKTANNLTKATKQQRTSFFEKIKQKFTKKKETKDLKT